MTVWVFTGILVLCTRLCRGEVFLSSVPVTVSAVGMRAYTVILAVEERTKDCQGLSALESSGGLANS